MEGRAMKCTKCGETISQDSRFCEFCGNPVEVAPVEVIPVVQAPIVLNDPQYQEQAKTQYETQNQQMNNEQTGNRYAKQNAGGVSRYDGGVLGTLAAGIVTSLIITFTCGIATPWAICYMYKFVINHIIIDGKRLCFDGNGAQLFGNWIKWFLLTLVTCGIYSFWVTPRLYDWIAKHTHIEN